MIVILLAAVLLSYVVPGLLALGWNAMRRRAYLGKEEKKNPLVDWLYFADEPAVGGEDPGASQEPAFMHYHRTANDLQNRYHAQLAFSVSSLMVGFIALSASATIGASVGWFQTLAAIVDPLCFLNVIVAFLVASGTRRRWMKERIFSEFLRQRHYLAQLMAAPSHQGEVEQAAVIERLTGTVAEALRNGTSRIAAVRNIWRSERARYVRDVKTIPADERGCVFYLKKRILRQAHWFHASRSRIHGQMGFRHRALFLLFVAVFAMSVGKSAIVMLHAPAWIYENKTVLTFLILMLLGLATWVTALFLGQNTKTLYFRYLEQEQQIVEWLNAHVRPGFANGVVSGALAMDDVLRFEDVMVEELVAWLEITDHETIELSPV